MNDTTRERTSIAHALGRFLSTKRKALLIGAVVVVGGIIVAVGAYQFLDRRAERSARAVELLEERWVEWQTLPEEERTESELTAEIRSSIEEIGDAYRGSYGDLRARYIGASLEWELERYEEARTAYRSIVDDFPRSHLVGVALAGAAAASENLSDIDEARGFLARIADGEGLPHGEQARALFNLGRLAEAEQEHALALDYYNRLIEEHGESSWTNLGRGRIIWLASQGLAGDE